MSIIARQGIKYSIIGYLGFFLGTFSAIFIFPYDMHFYGKLQYILPSAEMLLPIVVFGISFSNVKFYPQAQAAGKTHNFLSLSLLAVGLNFIVFLVLFYLFFHFFPQYRLSQLYQMKEIVLPLIFILALSAVFNKYISNFKRIAVSNIFENLFPKIANLSAFSLFVFLGYTQQWSYVLFLIVFALALGGYFFYTNRLEKIKWDFSLEYIKKNRLYATVITYSLFGFLGNIGNYIAFRVDKFMIGEFLSFEENGIYSIMLSVLSFVMIPQMGLFNISAPLINKCITEDNLRDLDKLHKKTSLSLFFVGAILFSCILVGFPYLTDYIKNGDQLKIASPVIWILGSAMIFDLATGFNGHIISLSKYYRFTIVVMLFLAITTIVLNYFFLTYTTWGLYGIATATTISLTLFNIVKLAFNYLKFKVFPFTIEMVYASVVCTLGITVSILLPESTQAWINLFYKPLVVIIIIGIGNHYMRIIDIERYLTLSFVKSLFK